MIGSPPTNENPMDARASALPIDAFEQFSQRLHAAGVRDALSYLLHLTNYRFIDLFQFRNGMATATVHVDREQPDDLRVAEVAEDTTYCCYVRDSGEPFSTPHAQLDERLLAHPARTRVVAYTGVPVMNREGVLLASLCLHDVVPRDPAQIDLPLLLQVSSALAYGGFVPPYPDPLPT